VWVCASVCICAQKSETCSKVREIESVGHRYTVTTHIVTNLHAAHISDANLCVDLGVHVCSSVWIRVQPPFQRPVVATVFRC